MLENAVIVIQSYNRFWMLKLMQYYIGEEMWDQVVIFDDGSTDERILNIFEDKMVYIEPPHKPLDERGANSRCGGQRRKIVNWFLNETDKDYLIWMDDDIIISPEVLDGGLEDMKAIELFTRDAEIDSTMRGVGIYSFHTWMRDAIRFEFNENIYGLFSLTGESCCIQSRKTLELIGNNYSADSGGYLDLHVKKMRDHGHHTVCRLTNPWDVQHIGIGNTSYIHPDHNLKYWHNDLWHSYETKKYLVPEGFNPRVYMDMVNKDGAKSAPKTYYKHLLDLLDKEYTMKSKEVKNANPNEIKDSVLDVQGKLEIKVHKGSKDGKVVDTIEIDNLVVDNAIVIMKNLLAGNSMSNYYISRMQFGTGDTAAAVTDTTLEVAISPIKAISAVTQPTARSVRFTAYLLEDEANGFQITEAGLLAANVSPALATRTVFGALTKSNDFVFEFSWTLYWS